MAYNEAIADRIRAVLASCENLGEEPLGEVKMFGGLCLTLGGKMLVGVIQDRIMIRLSDEQMHVSLNAHNVLPMDFTGKPLRNFAYLSDPASISDEDLRRWIYLSAEFVRSQVQRKGKDTSPTRGKVRP